MSATLVFATKNDFAQYVFAPIDRKGICTAATMHWAKKILKSGPVDSFAEIGVDKHTLNAQMATLRKLDNDPAEPSDRAGLQVVGNIGNKDRKIGSVKDVTKLGEDNDDAVILFWTEEHTMGYWRRSGNKEFFDVEVGLYRAKTTAEIETKMEEITKPYGNLTGARVVKLKD